MKVKIRLAATKVWLDYKGHGFSIFKFDTNNRFCVKDKDILNYDELGLQNIKIGDVGRAVTIVVPEGISLGAFHSVTFTREIDLPDNVYFA